MFTIGSQKRETLADSGYRFIAGFANRVILENDCGSLEWWQVSNHAGYVIEIDGIGYEYVRGYNGHD